MNLVKNLATDSHIMSKIKEHYHEEIIAGQKNTAIKFHQILFSTPMVQVILEGKKIMTRRMKGLKVINGNADKWKFASMELMGNEELVAKFYNGEMLAYIKCPYGKIGDVLWVRERFCNINKPEFKPEYHYFTETLDAEDYDPSEWKWKPSIHMPKEACRIFLKITDIIVERLQDIREDVSYKEGIKSIKFYRTLDHNVSYASIARLTGTKCERHGVKEFHKLWDSLNEKTHPWESNPWVWVISFERCDKPENF